MDFRIVILFICVYFIRPQDWVPGLAGLNIVTPIMGAAIIAMFIRPKGFSGGDLLKVPIDWMMLIYYAYAVMTSEDSFGTFKEALPLFAFYVVTRQALDRPERLQKFLFVWLILICVIAGMALVSLVGLDLTRAAPIVEMTQGRLVLNTWMHNNPNALGHSVMVGIPLAYYCLWWRKPAMSKVAALVLIGLMGFCVYETESKGAFLSGFVTLTASLMFGRPKIVQGVMLAVAIAIGMSALYQLPRMSTLRNARADEGIMGRLLAWDQAREVTKDEKYGKGWKKFVAWIEWEGERVEKSTHGSYVKVGADLGYPGLLIYLGILYCGFRVLFQARTIGTEDERIRRMLFVILFSFWVSNWMIDRAYHTEYFVLSGAIAAFHLMLRERGNRVEEADEEEIKEERERERGIGRPIHGGQTLFGGGVTMEYPGEVRGAWTMTGHGGSGALMSPGLGTSVTGPAETVEEGDEDELEGGIRWRRLTLVDFGIMFVLLQLTLKMWDYIMENL